MALDACRDSISGVSHPPPSARQRLRAQADWRQLDTDLSLTDLWDSVSILHIESESIRLLLHITDTLASLDCLLSTGGDTNAVPAIETSVQRVLEIYRAAVLSAPPGDELVYYDNDQVDAIFRSIISFATVVSIISQSDQMRRQLGWEWGRHLWSPHEFRAIDFTAFEPSTLPESIALLLPDQFDELRAALQNLSAVTCATNVRAVSTALGLIEVFGKAICDIMGTNWEPEMGPTDPPTLDLQEVCIELGKTQRLITQMIARGTILSVRRWNGDLAFPEFQFYMGEVRDIVSEILPNVPADAQGWQFSHFLYALDQRALSSGLALSAADVRDVLEQRTLWKQPHSMATYDNASDTAKRTQIETAAKLYRVTGTEYTPFFFSSTPAQHGRYDLPDDCGKGTNYLAFSKRGAWEEVLDRNLLVSLRTLMGRTVWELSPQGDPITVVDMTDVDQTHTPREQTQAQALNIFQSGAIGIAYRLRPKLNQTSQQVGIALFGPVGACLPGDTGTGAWSTSPHSAINDPELWEYLAERRSAQQWLPVKLRRFPGEVSPRAMSPVTLTTNQLLAARNAASAFSRLFDHS